MATNIYNNDQTLKYVQRKAESRRFKYKFGIYSSFQQRQSYYLAPSHKGHNRTLSDKQNYNKNILQKKIGHRNEGQKNSRSKNRNKPLISPCQNKNFYEEKKNSQYATRYNESLYTGLYCINHHYKPAEFYLQVQQQTMGYCKKCAVKLASQGFTVIRVQPIVSQINNQPQNYTKRLLPRYPEYQNNKKFKQIQEFLTQLQQTQIQHLSCLQRLSKTDKIYEQQISYTQLYYSELLEFVQKMRDDHLSDLYKQRRRDTQVAFIQHDYLRENVQQMEHIWVDIHENIQNIVQRMEQQQVKNTLRYYKQKILVNHHKIEQMNDFFQKITSIDHSQYQQKLQKVQDFLMKIWIETEKTKINQLSNESLSTYLPHQIRICPPKGQGEFIKPVELVRNKSIDKNTNKQARSQKQSKGHSTAFRKLFPEEQERQIKNMPSPQFKQI